MIPKRAAALFVALVLAVPLQAWSAAAEPAAPDVWTGKRTITDAVVFWENAPLEIAGGANLTFDIPSSIPPDLENSTPSLSVHGGLLVNGTAGCQTAFCATGMIMETFASLAYLDIVGNGLPGQFFVRNCTFRNMHVVVENAAGEFSDCSFQDCHVSLSDTPAVVRNCTFRDSYIGVWTERSQNVSTVKGCIFEGNSSRDDTDAAIYGYGNVNIEGSQFNDYFWPIYSTNGSLEVAGCRISGVFGMAGIFLPGGSRISRPSIPTIRDTVVENCAESCIFASERVIIRNCTLAGSRNGLMASDYGDVEPFTVTLEGNRIYNNSEYGIRCGPPRGINISGPENNTFDDGKGLANGNGRLVSRVLIRTEIVDQWGSRLGNLSLRWTDALGDSGSETFRGEAAIDWAEYHIDNAGVRRDHFPITVTAEKGGHTCQTVVNGPDDVARLVITIPPRVDIAIVNISTVPIRPRPGDFVRFNVTVTGPGEWMMVDAFLAVNGTRYPQTLGFGPADGNRSFLIDWQTVVAGKYTVEVRLDPQNEIHETNETNNNMTRDFVVAAPPAPPAGFSWPLAGFSALIVVLFVVVIFSGLRSGKRKPRPPENGEK